MAKIKDMDAILTELKKLVKAVDESHTELFEQYINEGNEAVRRIKKAQCAMYDELSAQLWDTIGMLEGLME